MHFFSYCAVFLLWVLHFLPFRLLSVFGCGLGWLFYHFGKHRRHVVEINLALCFPELDDTQRTALAKAHFQALGRSFLDRSLLWWSSPQRLRALIHLEGEENIRDLLQAGTAVIFLAPHFIGFDAGGAILGMSFDSVGVYSKQKNKVFDRLVLRGRRRFRDHIMLSRQEGVLSTIKAMRSGRPLRYLPDMDFGRRDAIFVPFFGVPAATITGLSRLARVAKAKVVLVTPRLLPGGAGYHVNVSPPWTDFPTDDVEADTRRMNAAIEEIARTMPEQYYWVHRRFKTRPQGEASYY
jgi:KDO2-lipid IV(A) lauroyltransferase